MKRLLLLLLAISLLLSACGGDLLPGGDADVAKGRYMEEELALPELGYLNGYAQLPDGSLRLLANETHDNTLGPWNVWQSADGQSWEEASYPWIAELDDAVVVSSAFDEAGGIYMLYQPGARTFMEEYLAATPEQQQNITQPEPVYAYGDMDGLTPLDFEPPESIWPNGMRVAPGGDIMLEAYFELLQSDKATGETKNTFGSNDNGMLGDYTFYGDNQLALSVETAIELYDMETGGLTGEIPISEVDSQMEGRVFFSNATTDRHVLAWDEKNGGFFYADRTGLYRTTEDASITEKLLDGGLCSLSMPSIQLRRLFVMEDGSFLTLAYGDEKWRLFRYAYDPDIPTVPGTELRIYSLHENKTVRQAIGQFQLANPDVRVTYDIGLSGADITASDALRTLSTEILAGNGPDLLVLDGMPVESYIGKSVLMDLAPLLDGDINSGTLAPNVSNTYRRDAALYAIPARFSVPMLLGPSSGEAGTLEQLSAYATSHEIPEALIGGYPNVMFGSLYDSLSPGWFREDGTLDEAAFQKDLLVMGQLDEWMKGDEAPDETENAAGYTVTTAAVSNNDDLLIGAVHWKSLGVSLALGSLNSIAGAAPPEAALTQRGEGSFAPFPKAGTYLPRTVLGINAATAQPELAEKFVRFTLSEEVLSNDFTDGMPANLAALRSMTVNPYSEEDDGAYISTVVTNHTSVDDETGEEISVSAELQYKWPSAEFLNNLVDTLLAIETPVPDNTVVREMILTETQAFFAGEKGLEETVASLSGKLNLYLTE